MNCGGQTCDKRKPDDRGWDGWLAAGGNVTYALVFCLLQIMGKPYSSEEF